MTKVLIVNGALGGALGNTAELLGLAEEAMAGRAKVTHLELNRSPRLDRITSLCGDAEAFLFGTGTYWDSWGSPLQSFFEDVAHTEGSEIWRGKPAGAIVTAHAVGAKVVLSRMQGVLNAFGMLIPPFGGMAYTWANDVALAHAPEHLARELWRPSDVEVVCHNVLEAATGGNAWKCWPTSHGVADEKWLTSYSKQEEQW